MLKIVAAVAAGVVLWVVLAIGIDFCLRTGWPDYAAVEKAMTFTMPMMIARLGESTVALVIASWAAGRIAPGTGTAWGLGIVLFLIFVPIHYSLWSKFPGWYHAYFLASLLAIPPLVAIVSGGRGTQQAAA